MKNILLTAIASIGLSTASEAQTQKNAAQYRQEILAVFAKAVEDGKVSQSPFHMQEGDECYAFDKFIQTETRQVYYCKDTKKAFIESPKRTKNQEEQELRQLLDAITAQYPE